MARQRMDAPGHPPRTLAPIHGCIGAVDPVRTFCIPEQKLLPELATGQALSGFALTETCAGSELTALRTAAVPDGNDYMLNGEKLLKPKQGMA